jgi:GNAT superfamily N-acetyltransferase
VHLPEGEVLMEILPYDTAIAPELCAAYNQAILGVPHCYPVGEGDFARALDAAAGGEQRKGRLHSEVVFVAREEASIRGFIHVAVERPERPDRAEQGIIRFFWYERGHRRTGQALLASTEERFRQRGLAQVTAFWQDYRYPFYHFDHAYMSERLDQVHALLAFNGYERVAGEVYLDWPDYEPVAPAPAQVRADIFVEWEEGRGKRPSLLLNARQGDKHTGVCKCVSCGEFSRADEAQDWFLTTWLNVAEGERGKGLGRHLLQRALQEMREAGYRHACISTSWDNFRAFLFYSNYGYRVVDWTYGLRRELK